MSTRTDPVNRSTEASPSATPVASDATALPTHVLDALELGVVALDRERRVSYANRWIEDLLG